MHASGAEAMNTATPNRLIDGLDADGGWVEIADAEVHSPEEVRARITRYFSDRMRSEYERLAMDNGVEMIEQRRERWVQSSMDAPDMRETVDEMWREVLASRALH
jgi:uncharacterized protein (UPF0305 family)